MTVKDLMKANRSYRRFIQDEPVERKVLEELIKLARLSPSGQNIQPLKFFLSCRPDTNAMIFKHIGWAGYLKDWPGPDDGERPSGYILILGDTSISPFFGCDHGIAAQSIRLGAIEVGLGSCIIASINRKELADLLQIPANLEILLAIAIGRPRETVVIDPVGPDGDIKYWRDTAHIHHVPKRSLAEIIVS